MQESYHDCLYTILCIHVPSVLGWIVYFRLPDNKLAAFAEG